MADPAATLHALELQLLQPEVRADRAMLESLLAPDFREFGSSGRVFDRESIIASLAEEQAQPAQTMQNRGVLHLVDFACDLPASEVALVTYRLLRNGSPGSLRSSVWVYRDGRWQMRFHQGTRLPAPG